MKKFNLKILNFGLLFCIFLSVFYCLSLVTCGLSLVCAEDKIAAIVNNETITQKDLSDFLNFVRIQLSREYSGEQLENKILEMKKDLLDRLIEDRLILQAAKKENISPDQARVKARLNELRSRYVSDSEFKADLARQGIVISDVENKIKEQILMYNIIEAKVRDKIIIRPEEVTAFYNKNKADFVTPEERTLEVIALENKDQADSFAYGLKNAQKLEDLAARYPVTVNKLKADRAGELRKDVEDAVFSLSIGELTEPLKIDDKYYLFRLADITNPRLIRLPEAQARINALLFEKKMQEELAKWVETLRQRSYIKVVQE